MLSTILAALLSGATTGLLMRRGMSKLKAKVDNTYEMVLVHEKASDKRGELFEELGKHVTTLEVMEHGIDERLDALEKAIERLDLFDESIASITSRFESVPTRQEVGDAFRVAAELEQQQRERTAQEKAQAAEAEARFQAEQRALAEQEAQQAALVEEWAHQQRLLIRQEVEADLAAQLERRAQQAVAANPLNARPAAMPAIEPPAGFEQVNRNRFARPLLGDSNTTFPDPFLEGEGG